MFITLLTILNSTYKPTTTLTFFIATILDIILLLNIN